jgi:hypothetical protein
MGLEELRRLIAESDRGDWNVVSCFGLPLFLPWSPEGEFNEHNVRAAYRPNVSIGLAWGATESENYAAEWVQALDEPLHRDAPLKLPMPCTTACSSLASLSSSLMAPAATCRCQNSAE